MRRRYRRTRGRYGKRVAIRRGPTYLGRTNYFRLRTEQQPTTFAAWTTSGSVITYNTDALLNGVPTWSQVVSAVGDRFVAMFTYYRLRKVVYKVRPLFVRRPMNSAFDVPTTNPQVFADTPLMYRIVSSDREIGQYTSSSEWTAFRQDNVVIKSMYKSFNVSFKPKILNLAYEATADFGYQPKYAGWMPFADNAVPHYGIQFMPDITPVYNINPGAENAARVAQRWTITPIYYWEFKGYKPV